MNNFTKSIVYSGVVLAAGLVAIFAIYNNVNNPSAIEPASGDPVITESYQPYSENQAATTSEGETIDSPAAAAEAATDAATDAADAAEDAADAAKKAEAAADAAAEASSDAAEAASEATDAAEATDGTPAATEPSSGTEEAPAAQ